MVTTMTLVWTVIEIWLFVPSSVTERVSHDHSLGFSRYNFGCKVLQKKKFTTLRSELLGYT